MRAMLFHASSMRGSSAFHPHTGRAYDLFGSGLRHELDFFVGCFRFVLPVQQGDIVRQGFEDFRHFDGDVSPEHGFAALLRQVFAEFAHVCCVQRCDAHTLRFLLRLAFAEVEGFVGADVESLRRKSCRYESTSCAENAKARSSATLSVWCLMRSMKLNGRSASSGNSPSSRSSCVRMATYWCPNVETDGTSSMPRFAQYWSNSSVSAGVSGLDPRHVSLIPSNANVCSM